MNMMNTKIERVNPEQIDETIMEEAGRLIAEGELVAFPTETVYGLGGDALHPEAARKIYAAKGRPSDNPLIVHIADFSDMERVAREVPEAARKLADAFWPGPLTMIVWKSDAVPMATTGGMDTVAVRMPNHPVALDLIRKSGCLIAAPSANTSGRPSPTEASHVAEDLSGRIAMILDGGPVGIGIESTIIDLTESKPMVLRPGYITPQMLSGVLGEEVIIDPGIIAADDTRKPKAPGMKYKHYAPKADMVIVDGPSDAVVSKINALVHQKQENGQKDRRRPRPFRRRLAFGGGDRGTLGLFLRLCLLPHACQGAGRELLLLSREEKTEGPRPITEKLCTFVNDVRPNS